MASGSGEIETLPVARGLAGARRAQRLRRAGLVAMAAVVAAGASGLLGVHQSTTTASADGYTASFTYDRVARAGWDVPWRLSVSRAGGFDGPVTVAITGDAYEIYESQRFWPEPSQETRDQDRIYLTFDEPPGDTLVVDYDACIQPTAQRGREMEFTILTDDTPRVSLRASTTLLP